MPLLIGHVLDIDAPPAVVWELLTDLARYDEWNPFVIGCRSTLVPGEPIDLLVKLRAKPQNQREWMIENVAGKRFAYRMKPFPCSARFRAAASMSSRSCATAARATARTCGCRAG